MAYKLYVKYPGADEATSVLMGPRNKVPCAKALAVAKVIILDNDGKVVTDAKQETINGDAVISTNSDGEAQVVVLEGGPEDGIIVDTATTDWASSEWAASPIAAAGGDAGISIDASAGSVTLGGSPAMQGQSPLIV